MVAEADGFGSGEYKRLDRWVIFGGQPDSAKRLGRPASIAIAAPKRDGGRPAAG